MNNTGLRKKLMELRDAIERNKPFDASSRPDAVVWAEKAAFCTVDDWQADVLRSTDKRLLLLCSRQVGKSFTTALKAAFEVAYNPNANILIISPTLRQSKLLFEKVESSLLNTVPRLKFDVHTRTVIRLSHGGTVRALPGDSPDKIRGLTSSLVIIDEGAFVRESVMNILLPMLATTDGTLIILSTPSGQEGLFYEAWETPEGDWKKVKVLATNCPRITPEFLLEARRKLGNFGYRQEFECEFLQGNQAFFSAAAIDAAFDRGMDDHETPQGDDYEPFKID